MLSLEQARSFNNTTFLLFVSDIHSSTRFQPQPSPPSKAVHDDDVLTSAKCVATTVRLPAGGGAVLSYPRSHVLVYALGKNCENQLASHVRKLREHIPRHTVANVFLSFRAKTNQYSMKFYQIRIHRFSICSTSAESDTGGRNVVRETLLELWGRGGQTWETLLNNLPTQETQRTQWTDRLHRLDRLNRLNRLESFNFLHRLKQFKRLNRLNGLNRLNRHNRLNRLNRLYRLNRLNRLNKLNRFHRLSRIDRLSRRHIK